MEIRTARQNNRCRQTSALTTSFSEKFNTFVWTAQTQKLREIEQNEKNNPVCHTVIHMHSSPENPPSLSCCRYTRYANFIIAIQQQNPF